MADEGKFSGEKFLGEVHGEGAETLDVELDFTVSEEDVLYFLNRHPYLQLLNLDPSFEDADKVNFIRAKTGWTIQDFGDALSSSQGDLFFSGVVSQTLFASNDDEEGEGDVEFIPGEGTVVKQAFDTTNEMIDLIAERWKGVHIVSGVELMRWAAWAIATEKGLEVYGFEPTKEDQARAQRIKKYEIQKGSAKKPGSKRGE